MISSGKLRKTCGTLGASVVAAEPIAAGETLLSICGRVQRLASRYTLQVGNDVHVDPVGQCWGFINHSCDPNCRFDFGHWQLVAIRPIAAGEELGFNYLTTEWDMASPFLCRCGAAGCLGRISGLRHLRPEQVRNLRSLLAPHLRRKLRHTADRLQSQPA
jgi:SET domain-containing protein